jgi:two-component system sensor histidine kinase KdpD
MTARATSAHSRPANQTGQAGPAKYAWALVSCGLVTLITAPMRDWLQPANAAMLYLLAVALVAVRLGRGPSVFASFVSVALFDFFHVPPHWSFAVSHAQYLLTFAVMLAVALIISHLTAGMQKRTQEAQDSAERSRALYSLASRLTGAISIEQALEAIEAFTTTQWQAQPRLLVPGRDSALQAALATQLPLSQTIVLQATALLNSHGKHHAHMAQEDDAHHALLPLMGSTRSRGVLVLSVPAHGANPFDNDHALLNMLASLVANALERLHFVQVAYETQMEVNDERLRGSILSALSHDIRTPLTSLFGLADTLSLMQPPLPAAAQEMASSIRDQAMRLHRMVSNLLDMARLQSGRASGHLSLRREWQPIEEVIGASIQLLGHGLSNHQVRVHMPEKPPLLLIDAVLMERVFGNLLENAGKYAPPGTPIDIHLSLEPGAMRIRISNEGAGFPPDKLKQVFDVFERGAAESNIPGVGLGLSICRVIVEAHGGSIQAINPPNGGAEVSFTLPLGTPPAVELEAEPEAVA